MAGRRYTLIWNDLKGSRRRYIVEAPTWIGRPGGWKIKAPGLDPYSVILYREDTGEYVATGYEDSTVSRRHALLKPSVKGVLVKDVGTHGRGSLNGTYVNGERIEPLLEVLARPGDIITVGAQASFKVGILSEDVVVEPTKPGEILVLDSSKARLSRELYTRSLKLEDGRIIVVAPRDVKTSFDADEGHRIRIEGRGTSTKDYERTVLLSIENMLKEAIHALELEPRDEKKIEEAVENVRAILILQETSKVLLKIVDKKMVDEIASIADLVVKGRHSPAQLNRLRMELSTLVKVIEIKLKSM
ncbi:MAG: FHA domain-containing protein [Desulfurococcales archaeon]|nr:FHA domain-containing protein [Desulfurococcales archaeon]